MGKLLRLLPPLLVCLLFLLPVSQELLQSYLPGLRSTMCHPAYPKMEGMGPNVPGQ